MSGTASHLGAERLGIWRFDTDPDTDPDPEAIIVLGTPSGRLVLQPSA